MKPLLALLLMGGWVSSPADTVMDVRQGDRLILRDLDGHVVIDTWDRSQLAVEAFLDEEDYAVTFERRGSRILPRWSNRRASRDAEIRLRVPNWLALEITGRDLDVRARGLESDFTVLTLAGDVVLENMTGSVQVRATDGEVNASGLDGSARLRTGDADITIRDSRGALDLETVDGEIRLIGMQVSSLSARSTEGEIDFQGTFAAGGTYGFFSHSGDITLRLEPPLNLDARILAYGGVFGSDFPVRAQAIRPGEGMEFSMGTGGASLTVETLVGVVRLTDGRSPATQEISVSISENKRGVKR